MNSTRKWIPIVESEQKVQNLWFQDRTAQAVGPNAAAVVSSSHMVFESGKIPAQRIWGRPGTVLMWKITHGTDYKYIIEDIIPKSKDVISGMEEKLSCMFRTDTAGEWSSHTLLSSYVLPPPLLAQFNNGLLHRYVAGSVCSVKDFSSRGIYNAVANRLGQWHGVLPVNTTQPPAQESLTDPLAAPIPRIKGLDAEYVSLQNIIYIYSGNIRRKMG